MPVFVKFLRLWRPFYGVLTSRRLWKIDPFVFFDLPFATPVAAGDYFKVNM
jgi:hypothetical protein